MSSVLKPVPPPEHPPPSTNISTRYPVPVLVPVCSTNSLLLFPRKFEKVGEGPRKLEKVRTSMRKLEKVGESPLGSVLRRFGKVGGSRIRVENVGEGWRKFEEVGESWRKLEKVPRKSEKDMRFNMHECTCALRRACDACVQGRSRSCTSSCP